MSLYPSVRIEGGLLGPDLLDQLFAGELPGQRAADFRLAAKRNLTDEIASAFTDARALWGVFQHRLERLKPDDLATKRHGRRLGRAVPWVSSVTSCGRTRRLTRWTGSRSRFRTGPARLPSRRRFTWWGHDKSWGGCRPRGGHAWRRTRWCRITSIAPRTFGASSPTA